MYTLAYERVHQHWLFELYSGMHPAKNPGLTPMPNKYLIFQSVQPEAMSVHGVVSVFARLCVL